MCCQDSDDDGYHIEYDGGGDVTDERDVESLMM